MSRLGDTQNSTPAAKAKSKDSSCGTAKAVPSRYEILPVRDPPVRDQVELPRVMAAPKLLSANAQMLPAATMAPVDGYSASRKLCEQF
jgi:hypothetical protein